MKKLIFILIAVVMAISMSSCEGSYYVSERPADVYYERPVAPGADYVWIGGDWVWTGGSYHWHHGYWDRPRAGRHWVEGSWHTDHRGYKWNHGHWE